MALFAYKAKNQHGEKVSGKVEAQHLQNAAAILRERGLFLISMKEIGEEDSLLPQSFSRVSKDDIVTFTRQLATMITAGLSLIDSLSLLHDQSKPALKKVIGNLLRSIEGGNTFAKSLQEESIFSRIYIHLIMAGETAGVLDNVLLRLADNLEKEKNFRGKVKGALIYPVIVIIGMFAVAAVMMIFVIPKLSVMYEDFGAELPLVTQILISASNFFSSFWYVFAVLIAGAVFGLRQWRKTKVGAHKIDKFLLNIPVFGLLRQKVILTEFSRTMSLLLNAGISLIQALEITSDAAENILYRDALKEAAGKVEKGASLSSALVSYKEIFPPIVHQMIAVGEETGKLDEVLMKVSVYFESESEQAVKTLTSAMEPMIMIVLGIGVGFLIIAIVMPIYSLTSQF